MYQKFDPTAMDEATKQAEAELHSLIKRSTPAEVSGILALGAWWMSWYLKAGHKRLARLLLAIAKQAAKDTPTQN